MILVNGLGNNIQSILWATNVYESIFIYFALTCVLCGDVKGYNVSDIMP